MGPHNKMGDCAITWLLQPDTTVLSGQGKQVNARITRPHSNTGLSSMGGGFARASIFKMADCVAKAPTLQWKWFCTQLTKAFMAEMTCNHCHWFCYGFAHDQFNRYQQSSNEPLRYHSMETWLPGTDNEPRECVAKQSTEKGMTQCYRTLGSLAPT